MPKVDEGGISGESFKEVWLPAVMQSANEEDMRSMMKGMPKGMPMPEYSPPWTSIGMAPTQRQLEASDYEASA